MARLLLLAALAGTPSPVPAAPSRDGVFAINMALGGLFAAFSSRRYRRPGERPAAVFWRNFSRGALGGYLNAKSKEYLGRHDDRGDTYLAEHFLNDIGSSFVENGCKNRPLFHSLRLTWGPLLIHTGPRLRLRPMYSSLGGIAVGLTSEDGRVDWRASARTGVIVIKETKNNPEYAGLAMFGVIMTSHGSSISTYHHELIHSLQMRQTMSYSVAFTRDDYVTDSRRLSFWNEVYGGSVLYVLGGGWLAHDKRLHEVEADFFAGRYPPSGPVVWPPGTVPSSGRWAPLSAGPLCRTWPEGPSWERGTP